MPSWRSHLEFGGQAVGVPAEAALHLVAAHGAVPRHDVLDVAGQQMPVVRQAVGERRSVVEHVLRCVVATRDAGAEGVVAAPSSRGPRVRVPGSSVLRRPASDTCGHCRCVVSCARSSGTGTTSRWCASAAVPPRLRTRRVRRSTAGVTGPPVRFYWAGSGCSSEGSPVMAGSMPLRTILVPGVKASRWRPPTTTSPFGFRTPAQGTRLHRDHRHRLRRHRGGPRGADLPDRVIRRLAVRWPAGDTLFQRHLEAVQDRGDHPPRPDRGDQLDQHG